MGANFHNQNFSSNVFNFSVRSAAVLRTPVATGDFVSASQTDNVVRSSYIMILTVHMPIRDHNNKELCLLKLTILLLNSYVIVL